MSEAWNPDKAAVSMAQSLRTIVQCWDQMSEEALEHYDDPDMPGGEALNQAAGAASVSEWERIFEQMESEGQDVRYASDQIGERHALLVLGDWEERVRHERDQPTGLRATVPRAADYLRSNLTWIVEHLDAAPFMQRELRACAGMLENVLKDGVRHDTSAAACFKDVGTPEEVKICGGRLVRRTLERRDCKHVARAIEMAKGVSDPVTVLRQTLLAFPEDELEHRECEQGGRDDVYKCASCRGYYTEAEYWLAVKDHYERQVAG